jgi:hypothetical protein
VYNVIDMNAVHKHAARTLGVVKIDIGMIGSRAHHNSVIMKSAIKIPAEGRRATRGSSLFMYVRNRANDETSVIEPP